MKNVTLCFLLDEDKICLAMKKRGFGIGKFNGVGGKIEENETIEEGAVREIEEEIGVKVNEVDLKKIGILNFEFKGKSEWNQKCHVFFIEKWENEPTETEEMQPFWFQKDKLPFNEMWIDDPLWLTIALETESINADFTFNSDGSEILDYKVNK